MLKPREQSLGCLKTLACTYLSREMPEEATSFIPGGMQSPSVVKNSSHTPDATKMYLLEIKLKYSEEHHNTRCDFCLYLKTFSSTLALRWASPKSGIRVYPELLHGFSQQR
ncbi:hypothetical protein CHS0354_041152 [Potamilus streckersoni]|uniref:Uncharacterized protein n=1 Tax=Potamilus streckersoni TaxID=2493646 RepID=A0AAE0SDV2_9BIVA|nr:hypothetical protein CHS0354_041152 [Potamilus streckersoni]